MRGAVFTFALDREVEVGATATARGQEGGWAALACLPRWLAGGLQSINQSINQPPPSILSSFEP